MSISGMTERPVECSGAVSENNNSASCSGGRSREWKALRDQGGPSAARRCSITLTTVLL